MKKIAILGGVVILLIAVIKIGGMFMGAPEKDAKETLVSTEETSPAMPGQTQAETGERITIEINNGTEDGESSTQGIDPAETLAQVPSQEAATAVQETSKAVAGQPVTPMDAKTMYATRSVHVRKAGSTDAEILSGLGPGQKVTATGETSDGWIRISFNGGEAYVYKSYLSANKTDVVVETTAAKKNTNTSNNNGSSAATKPAATKPAATKPAATTPAATTAAVPPSAPASETIAPFPGN